MTDRRRTALHEAAHAVIALWLRVSIGVVSIRPTTTYGGVCGLRGLNRMVGLEPGLPFVLQPARARRYTESLIRLRLAGPVADRMWFPSSGYTRTPKLVPIDVLPNLPPVAAAELGRIEEQANAPAAPIELDEDLAFTEAWLLVGSDLAPLYLTWASADTEAMVNDPLNVQAIERLADALLIHSAMAPRHVRAVVRGDRP